MGVLNFSGSLHANSAGFDIISSDAGIEDIDFPEDIHQVDVQPLPKPNRKRSKSERKCYDFREYGVDARRRGAKHQRRKQNFSDLLQMAGDGDLNDDSLFSDDHATTFAMLFMDDNKMKIWEGFMNLPEEDQCKYLNQMKVDKSVNNSENKGCHSTTDVQDDEIKYLLIDKKIRDMLRSKKLASEGLLKYYEDDMVSCMNEWFPSILVMNLESKYDRMLVYGICQFIGLPCNTIKLKDTSIIEIELNEEHSKLLPNISLCRYLRKKYKC